MDDDGHAKRGHRSVFRPPAGLDVEIPATWVFVGGGEHRDGYAFTIAVNDMIGTEYSMTNTSFAYYSGNAWKSFKTDLQSGSIDGGNNNVRYCDFHDFYDSYLSPEAVASLEASAASSEASSDSTDGGSVSAE